MHTYVRTHQQCMQVKAKGEIAEALAVVQAEFAIFKEQANMPKQIEEQIERLCQQQTINKKLELTVTAKDEDLAAAQVCDASVTLFVCVPSVTETWRRRRRARA